MQSVGRDQCDRCQLSQGNRGTENGSFQGLQTHIRSGFRKWRRPETKELPDIRNHAETVSPPTKMKEESGLGLETSMASTMLAQSLLTAARATLLSPIQSAFPSISLQLSSLQASPNCPECRNVILPELEASVESESGTESPTSSQHVAVEEIPPAMPSQEVHGRGRMAIESDAADLRNSGSRMDVDRAIRSPTSSMEMQCIGDATLVQFLRARKLDKEHFLDKLVVNEDVYQRHPWNYAGGEERGFAYFCCKTKYSRRRNMRRDRMSREGGRWKQQGMVHPIVNSSSQLQDAALKTYMSYIPCGKHNRSSIEQGHFLPHAPSGRLKHRHRMIEIALEEDLKLEKLFFKFKVAPKPFLVVCVLKRA